MYIYQITKAATNFEKSAGKLAYAKPLYNNNIWDNTMNTKVKLKSEQISIEFFLASEKVLILALWTI